MKTIYKLLAFFRSIFADKQQNRQSAQINPELAAEGEWDAPGVFYFKEMLLDQLGKYFVILERMKSVDRTAYDQISQLGAHMLPSEKDGKGDFLYVGKLSAWWNKTRPSFGAVAFGPDFTVNNPDRICPRLCYFQKFHPRGCSGRVQPVNVGDVYLCTVYWDQPEDKSLRMKRGLPTEFPIVINPDGSVRVLLTLQTEMVKIRARYGRERGRLFNIPRAAWQIDPFFVGWAKEHGIAPESYLTYIFTMVANQYEATTASMARVNVFKNNLTAVFSIDIKRSPYFFKDRDVVIDENGKKRRIFHVVRAHQRKNGSAVRLHFRGERSFFWNGYKILITVPGKHHKDFTEWNVPAFELESKEDFKASIPVEVMAKQWNNHIKSGNVSDLLP